MTTAEAVFIFVTSTAFLLSAICVKKINWHKLGFKPASLLKGWVYVLLFNIAIFLLVQVIILTKLVALPDWITDKDPLIPLVVIVFLQEILFRGLAVSWLERWGRQVALWASTGIFVLFHLVAPYAWSTVGIVFAVITFIGGYFWAWHFLKFRNIYLLVISHLLVNLSFNYVFF